MSKLREKLTWAKLKEFANNLPPEFLNEPVIWWGEERGGTVHNADKIEEDYLGSDDGYAPRSTYGDLPEEDIKEMEEEYGIMPKGTPILWVD